MIKKWIILKYVLTSFILFLFIASPITTSLKVEKRIINSSLIHIEFINNRFFLWIQPTTNTPDQGYPIIFLFHGATQHAFSWIFGLNRWSKSQMSFTKDALSNGYFIICFESQRPVPKGPRAWDIFNDNISDNEDVIYILSIIDWLESNSLPVDINNIFCAGFSSGAFMSSKLGIFLEEYFNAIAINSGGNAERFFLTEKGPLFDLTSPYNISKNHPPTLIVHGKQDKIVPVECSIIYYNDLKNADINSNIIIEPNSGHIWLKTYNSKIIEWFNLYQS